MARVNIITWMYTHKDNYVPWYPSVGHAANDPLSQAVYWRCVVALFHSSACQQHEVETQHFLFINEPPPKTVDQQNMPRLLAKSKVNLLNLPIRTKLPPDYFYAVTTQFYLVDLMEELARYKRQGSFSDDDVFMIFDSDCLFVRPIREKFVNSILEHGAAYYTIARSDVDKENEYYGLRFPELLTLAKEFSGREIDPVGVSGGEFYAISGRDIERFSCAAREALEISIQRHLAGKMKYNTEEPFFGYVYNNLGYPDRLANPYIQRVYTNEGFPKELSEELSVWHLIAEKGRFIPWYYNEICAHEDRSINIMDALPVYLAELAKLEQASPQKNPA